MQEKTRAARLVPDVSFLVDRGVPGDRIAARRTAGAFVAGGIVALVATLVSCAALFLVSGFFHFVRAVVGPAQDLLDARYLLPVCLFLLSATIFQGLASLAGWRAAFPREK
jgi:F0F1-type ATP synthase assembly protein I